MALSLRVDIVSDVLCPWCFIGSRRLSEVLRLDGSKFSSVDVNWHPYRLLPANVAPARKVDFYKQKFGAEQFQRAMGHVQHEGETCKIAFNYSESSMLGPSSDAHRLMAWIPKEKQSELMDALFSAHHEQGKLISDAKTLEDCAAQVGLDRSKVAQFLKSDEGKRELEAAIPVAREAYNVMGGVPHFVFTISGGASETRAIVSGAQHVDYFRLMLERAMKKAQAPAM